MNDSRIDRLYDLLPVIYRMRDAEQGEPLKALLQIISGQVNLVEDDIRQLYENWFIETCEDWVVPYIGELIGYEPVHEAGEPSSGTARQDHLRNKVLIPRREVANTIRYRRRKGTLALLELLSNDVAGWPARAVEFYQLLGWTQALNYQHSDRGRTVDLRNGSSLDLIDSPFDTNAHTADIRRINSNRTTGFYNIPSVGVFVWRLKSYSVTMTPAYCQQAVGDHCFTFSVLGNDSPLYINPEPETDPTHIADEFNLPVPVRRRLFEEQKTRLYGEGKSLQIWLSGKRKNKTFLEPVPPERIIAADLSLWRYLPPKGYVAVDPVLGRIAFPSKKPPGKCDVLVSYHYGFSTGLGGGEYDRPLSQLTLHKLYRVGAGETNKTINAAIDQWRQEQAGQTQETEQQKLRNAVIEIMDSGLYEEDFDIALQAGESLQIRSALGKRAVIGLSEKHRGRPESFSVQVARGSSFILDGLIVVGRPVEITAIENSDEVEQADQQSAESQANVSEPKLADIIIRHTTLVPGWEINADCRPLESTMASLKLLVSHLCVKIEYSIIGSIEVDPAFKPLIEIDDRQLDAAADEEALHYRCRSIEKEVRLDPIRICISDSILDATDPELEAIGTPDCPVGYALLTILRSTVFGQVQVHAIELAENCIFEGRITVARRQLGCMRFCYVMPESRTPRRYQCQPDLIMKKIAGDMVQEPDESIIQAAQECEANRVHPVFNSVRYGMPVYCQLAECCAVEIKRGADDESEMGVYHHLFQPQRMANLRVRLDEFIPARMDVGIILSS
jgi:hypothetical protein